MEGKCGSTVQSPKARESYHKGKDCSTPRTKDLSTKVHCHSVAKTDSTLIYPLWWVFTKPFRYIPSPPYPIQQNTTRSLEETRSTQRKISQHYMPGPKRKFSATHNHNHHTRVYRPRDILPWLLHFSGNIVGLVPTVKSPKTRIESQRICGGTCWGSFKPWFSKRSGCFSACELYNSQNNYKDL